MRTFLLSFALLCIAGPIVAQEARTSTYAQLLMRDCERYHGGDRERFCEIRDVPLRAPEHSLFVDGQENGSVTIYGWDKNEVLVRAIVQTWADTRGDAEALAKEIKIETDGDRVRSDGPLDRRHTSWTVNYEVWVPRRTNLEADTHNGGVSVEGVEGRMELRSVNGGIALRQAAGDIRARTTNGGVTAYLDGQTWRGAGLDLATRNGGVVLEIPRGYSAELETGTVSGSMTIDFPINVQGDIGRRINTKLGNGGPRVRAITTSGGVKIRER